MRGPDFPTGGVLVESAEAIRLAYETGRGSFRVRARWEAERLSHGLYQIVVTEIPYQVAKSRLVERIANLLSEKKLLLLADVRDESTEDIRLVLEPKSRTVDPQMLMESLFRATELEQRISLNMNVLDAQGVPRVMSLKEVLQAFLDHRKVVLERRSRHRLGEVARRLEVLEGYLIAFLNIDEVIRIIREEDEPKAVMIARWSLTDVQVEAILNLRLRALRRLEEIEIRRERDKLAAEQAGLQGLLDSERKQWRAIAKEIKEIGDQFGDANPLGRRRTTIGAAPLAVEVPMEAMVEREPITILLSEKGWIRAARGHVEADADLRFKDGDRGRFLVHAETTDRLLLFSTNGRFYTLAADKLPRGRGFGEPIRLMIDLPNDHDVVTLFPTGPAARCWWRPATAAASWWPRTRRWPRPAPGVRC